MISKLSDCTSRWQLENEVNREQSARVKTTKDVEFGMKNLITKPVLGGNDHPSCFNHEKLMSHVEEKNQDVPQQE